MKKLIFIFVIFLSYFCIQKLLALDSFSSSSINNLCKKSDTLNHDLILVKPLINFNDSNGGFYCEYYMSSFQGLYCGAVVQNIGHYSSTKVYLALDFFDYNANVTSTYYSDTIATLDSNQIDTLKISHVIFPGYYNYRISYRIISDSIDENESNNIDTIYSVSMFSDMWSQVSRAVIPTKSINLSQLENFQSGDFIGTTLKCYNGSHFVAALGIYLTEICPDSLTMIGKVYQNGILIASMPIIPQYLPWYFTDSYFGMGSLLPDSTYYIGVQFIYPAGTNIPIGIDTSTFHNFQSETIANIGNSWTTLNFVPLIRVICDPEEVPSLGNSNRIQVFPNPNNGIVNISNIENSSIEIFDLIGNNIISDYSNSSKKSLNLSALKAGNYIVKIVNNKGIVNKKITIIK